MLVPVVCGEIRGGAVRCEYLVVGELPDQLLEEGGGGEEGEEEGVEEGEEEKLVVAVPDAVVEPGTVVVHLEDTLSARGAMVAALGLARVADPAIPHRAVEQHDEPLVRPVGVARVVGVLRRRETPISGGANLHAVVEGAARRAEHRRGKVDGKEEEHGVEDDQVEHCRVSGALTRRIPACVTGGEDRWRRVRTGRASEGDAQQGSVQQYSIT